MVETTVVVRRGRPQAVTRDEIIDTTLALIAEGGVSNFTMQALADRLGIAKMTPYSYVDSKEHLLDLAADALFDRLTFPAPNPARWRAQLRNTSLQFRTMLAQYPGMAARVGTRSVPGMARFVEWYAELMMATGFDPATAAGALASIRASTLADLDELRPVASGTRQEDRALLRTVSASTAWLAQFEASQDSPERFYTTALDHILEGLELMLALDSRTNVEPSST